MIKAKHNIFIHNFFKIYTILKIRNHFNSVQITGRFNDNRLPVLLLANHISWWDGFWAMYLNLKVLNRKFHFMMLESQLRKFWFFRYTGGFSVKKNSREILDSINYTSELLENSENMVLIFPQGEIASMHNQNFTFEKGVGKIINGRQNKIQIIFMASFVDYFSSPKPALYLYFDEFKSNDFSVSAISNAYNQYYHNCVQTQINQKH